jgi:hypothetical protein
MKYKNQLGACFAILFLCCAAMLFSCAGCGGTKDKFVKKQNLNENKYNTKNTSSENSKNNNFEKEKINRNNKQFINNPNTLYAAKLAYGDEIANNNDFRFYPNNYGISVDKNLNIYSKIFKYNDNYDLLFDVDILKKHPYLSSNLTASSISNVQQLDGIHHMINRDEISPKFPQTFVEGLQYNSSALHSRIGVNTFIQKDDFLSISYFNQILPNEEILEFIQIPSVTTIEIYKKDKLLAAFVDLPFHIEEIQITKNGKYALIVHHQPISSKNYNQNIWNHYFSVYELKSKRLCFRKSIENQFSSGLVGRNNDIVTVGFEEFKSNEKPITINYYVRDEKKDIIEWIIDHNIKTDKKYKYVTLEGILYTLPGYEELHLLDFDSTFNSFKLNCQ